ncbi:MAG: TY-Chap domain-containing protein [Micromonosporaceae bacterium]
MDYDWSMFAARLDTVLTELAKHEQDVALIIADRREPTCFVQFLCGGDFEGIWAEVAGEKYLPGDRRYSKEDKQRLSADGWEKPGGRWWAPSRIPNWSSAHPMDGAGYRALADKVVRALHYVLRIEAPAALNYDAFLQASGEPLTLDRLELPRRAADPS